MTKEEKIAVLKALWRYKDCGYSEYEIRESLEFAIEELAKEPCEDCVSRKSLLDKLDPLYKEKIKTAPDNMAEGFLQVSNLIKNEPSVTPTRKKGKWEYDAYKDRSGGHCSRCGHFLRYGEKTNFCPDCGAEMESEK